MAQQVMHLEVQVAVRQGKEITAQKQLLVVVVAVVVLVRWAHKRGAQLVGLVALVVQTA